MDSSDPSVDFQTSTSSTVRLPSHLDHPIVLDDIQFLLENKKFFCRRHKRLKEFITRLNVTKSIYENCDNPYACLKNLITSHIQGNFLTKLDHELYTACGAAVKLFLLEKTVILNHENYDTPEYYNSYMSIFNSISDLPQLYKEKKQAEYIKNAFNTKLVEMGQLIEIINKRLYVEKEIIVCHCDTHGVCLAPTPLLLCVLDQLQTRFSLILYWKFISVIRGLPQLYNRGRALLQLIPPLYPRLKEKLFTLMKLWDSYVIGSICKDPVYDSGFTDLSRVTLEDILEIYPAFFLDGLNQLWYPDLTSPYSTGNIDLDIPISLELCTIAKCFGHPVLDAFAGVAQLREKACSVNNVEFDTVLKVRCIFVKLFIKGYIKRENKWPNIIFTWNPHPLISKSYYENRWPLEHEELSIALPEWDVIQFRKNFTYDMHVDTADLLSDKSCAPPLKYWTQKYDPCGFKILYGQSKPKLELQETRVILRYLSGKPGELEQAIINVNNMNFNSQNDISIQTRKERELSVHKGRTFCSQTYEQRLIQTSCESNIKKFIYPYLPYQTMTDTELSLSKKIAGFAKLQKEGGDIFNLDLEKWNMYQRAESVCLIAKDLDNLFGMTWLYQDSQPWMQRCYVINNSRVNPPKIDPQTGLPCPGPSCHINQFGGFEGMRQKLWTIGTFCTILLTSEECRLKTTVMGQGDNQVIIVKYTQSQLNNKAILRHHYLTTLKENFARQGLKLKLEETWISTRLLEYGKRRWYQGIPVPQGTKRASRIISDENDGIPTFEVSLGMIATATENISANDHLPDFGFLIYLLETICFLYRMNIITPKTHLIPIMAALLWPNILGGLMISNYANHAIRGFDDHLTVWISIYKYISRVDKELYDCICRLIHLTPRAIIDYKSLIMDIFSLNVRTLTTASLRIKEVVKECLPTFTTNPEVLSILQLTTTETPRMITTLMSMKPFFAPLAHEILRNSNSGTIEHLQNRLTNVQSIVKTTRKVYGSLDLYTQIISTNLFLLEKIRQILLSCVGSKTLGPKLKNNGTLNTYLQSSACSYTISRKMRYDSWKVDVVGASHPVPWEQFSIYATDIIPLESYSRSIMTEVSEELIKYPRNIPSTLGPFPIYLGSITHVKKTSQRVDTLAGSPFVTSLQALIDIRSWAIKCKSTPLIELCDSLILSKARLLDANFDLTTIPLYQDEIYGGSLQHRFRCVAESRGALLNCLYTITSFIRTTTNTFVEITSTGKDYNIFYQLIFLYIQLKLNDIVINYGPYALMPEYRSVLHCPDCTHEVADESITFLSPSSLESNYIPLAHAQVPISHNIIIATITSLSIGNGIQLGRVIQDSLRSSFSEIKLEGALKSINYSPNINMTELRSCDLGYLLLGVVRSSHIVRDLLKKYRSSHYYNTISFLFYPLAYALVTTNRVNEFFQLTKYTPISASCLSTLDNLSSEIAESIYHWFLEHKLTIIKNLFTLHIEDDNIMNHTPLLNWCLKLMFPICKETYKTQYSMKHDQMSTLIKDFDRLNSERGLLIFQPGCNKLLTLAQEKPTIFSEGSHAIPFTAQLTKKIGSSLTSEFDDFDPAQKPIPHVAPGDTANREDLRDSWNVSFVIATCLTCGGINCLHPSERRIRSQLKNILYTSNCTDLVDGLIYFSSSDNAFEDLNLITGLLEMGSSDVCFKNVSMTREWYNEYRTLLTEKTSLLFEKRRLRMRQRQVEHMFDNFKQGSVKSLDVIFMILDAPEMNWLFQGKGSFQSSEIISYEQAQLQWRLNPPQYSLNYSLWNESIVPSEYKQSSFHILPSSSALSFATFYIAGLHIINDCDHFVNSYINQVDIHRATLRPYTFEMFLTRMCYLMGGLNHSPSRLYPLLHDLFNHWHTDHILGLADGTGSLIHMVLHFLPTVTFSYVDKFDPKFTRTVDKQSFIPPALIGDECFDVNDIWIDKERLLFGDTDLGSNICHKKILDHLKLLLTKKKKSLLIICDLESLDSEIYLQLLTLLAKIYIQYTSSLEVICIIKIPTSLAMLEAYYTSLSIYTNLCLFHTISTIQTGPYIHLLIKPKSVVLGLSLSSVHTYIQDIKGQLSTGACEGVNHIKTYTSTVSYSTANQSIDVDDYYNIILEYILKLQISFPAIPDCILSLKRSHERKWPLTCVYQLTNIVTLSRMSWETIRDENPAYSEGIPTTGRFWEINRVGLEFLMALFLSTKKWPLSLKELEKIYLFLSRHSLSCKIQKIDKIFGVITSVHYEVCLEYDRGKTMYYLYRDLINKAFLNFIYVPENKCPSLDNSDNHHEELYVLARVYGEEIIKRLTILNKVLIKNLTKIITRYLDNSI